MCPRCLRAVRSRSLCSVPPEGRTFVELTVLYRARTASRRGRCPSNILVSGVSVSDISHYVAHIARLSNALIRGPAPYLASRNLPACAAYPTAFNNTAVQYARVGGVGEDFWQLPPTDEVDGRSGGGVVDGTRAVS